MSSLDAVDPYADTVYRRLTGAADAVALARFHGVADGIGYDPASAVAAVDAAASLLRSVRLELCTEDGR